MVTAEQSQTVTPNPELYLLGHSYDEERRLKKQAEELRQESARMFDRIGIEKGNRAIDLGCGPQGVLDLLSERVGPAGQVVGVERDRGSVAEARRFVADRALRNVSVIERDAAAAAIPEGSLDLVHARLLLVNVPHAESVVQEMIRLACPGGVVASHEADYLPHLCDPPLRAWDRPLRSSRGILPATALIFSSAVACIAFSVKPA
jgi:ubiquinone/menaquinone biosynthesis C-methylase UbiE